MLSTSSTLSLHDLFSALPVVPGLETEEDWQNHRQAFVQSLVPVGYAEYDLAERAALLAWRLRRLNRYQTNAAARGESAPAFAEQALDRDLGRIMRYEQPSEQAGNRLFGRALGGRAARPTSPASSRPPSIASPSSSAPAVPRLRPLSAAVARPASTPPPSPTGTLLPPPPMPKLHSIAPVQPHGVVAKKSIRNNASPNLSLIANCEKVPTTSAPVRQRHSPRCVSLGTAAGWQRPAPTREEAGVPDSAAAVRRRNDGGRA